MRAGEEPYLLSREDGDAIRLFQTVNIAHRFGIASETLVLTAQDGGDFRAGKLQFARRSFAACSRFSIVGALR